MFDFFKKDDKKGTVMLEETLPYFHDNYKNTNKTLYIVNKTLKDNKVLCYEDGILKSKFYNRKTLLTQNNMPIKLNKDMEIISANLKHSKNGFKFGQVYSIKGLGYLGNISDVIEVYLCTDKLVVFKDENGSFNLYKYEELNRMQDCIKLISG